MRNGYTDYSFVVDGKEYVSDTEYYEIQEEVEINERRNMLLLLVGFCIGFIFWGVITAVLISGAIIVDEDNSAIKVTFESTKKLLKSKYVVLKVIHGHINGPRE